MASGDFWTVSSGGVTKSCADWGMSQLKISQESCKTGELTFVIDGANMDSVAPFAIWSRFQLFRDGVCFFSGQVTDISRYGDWNSESLSYVISDDWWCLENCTFQQQWVTANASGGAGATMTTTRSRVIIGQSLSGVSMNLGQIMREVLYYTLYAAQGLPYPTTVDAYGVPTAPDMTTGPFQVGLTSPTMTIPFFEVKDKTCAEIIKLLVRWQPDTVSWIDYTRMPPTINIDVRGNLTGKTIQVFGGPVTSKFNPTPQYKLQVPVVVAKYEETITDDGVTQDDLIVDQFPLTVLPTALRGLVQTVDLLPANSTYQKNAITVTDCPRTETDSVALPWVMKQLPWLFAQTPAQGYDAAAYKYDIANITVKTITTVLHPDDPANTTPPLGLPPGPASITTLLNQATEEVITGAVAPWMQTSDNVFGLKVIKTVVLKYTGSDPTTLAQFNNNPGSPNTRVDYLTRNVTNGQTKTYEELTSLQQGEPAPLGNAEILYNILSALHQKGPLELLEDECSNLLPVGCVFNTSDGLPEWQTMNALVLRVNMDLDLATTKIEFGPTAYLGLDSLVELARANRGRLLSDRIQQRTTGQAGAGNAVIGHTHGADSSYSTVPGGGSAPGGPFAVSVANTAAAGLTQVFVATVALGLLFKDSSQISQVAIPNLAPTTVPCLGEDEVWLEGVVDGSGMTSGVTSCKVNTNGNGGAWDPNTDIQIGTTPAWITFAYRSGGSGAYPDVVQTGFRILLGVLTGGVGSSPVVVAQRIKTNLVMQTGTAYDATGRPFAYVYPVAL